MAVEKSETRAYSLSLLRQRPIRTESLDRTLLVRPFDVPSRIFILQRRSFLTVALSALVLGKLDAPWKTGYFNAGCVVETTSFVGSLEGDELRDYERKFHESCLDHLSDKWSDVKIGDYLVTTFAIPPSFAYKIVKDFEAVRNLRKGTFRMNLVPCLINIFSDEHNS